MAKFSCGKLIERQRVVLYGPKGVGKSTFATKFPKPVIVDIENGSGQIDVPRYSGIESFKEVKEIISEIAQSGAYQTVIIDTADWLEPLIDVENLKEYVSENPNGEVSSKARTIEEIPFGKGHARRKRFMKDFLKFIDQTLPNTNIVMIAHSKVARYDPPDNMKAPYNRYELECSAQASEAIGAWCDAMLFMTREIIVSEDKRKNQVKAKGGYQRIIYPDNTAFADAKNRWGLDAPFDADYSIIKPFIENGEIQNNPTKQPEVSEPESEDEIPMESKADIVFKIAKKIEKDPQKRADYIAFAARSWKWISEKEDYTAIPDDKLDKIIKAPNLFCETVSKLIAKQGLK